MNVEETEAVLEIKRAVRSALQEMSAHDAALRAEEQALADEKGRLTNRVSVAAIALTMLLSFLNFARGERADASQAALLAAARDRSDTEANWSYYQTRRAERGSYVVADDALARETDGLTAADPRASLAAVQRAEYQGRVAAIDAANQRVFFVVQDLEAHQAAELRRAARIDRSVDRYDMGVRVLTLAVVLLSITLLANRSALFWASVGIALVGAGIAVNGYLLLV